MSRRQGEVCIRDSLEGDGSKQLRGGVGMFSGRTPYVWLANQYGNTGIEFQRIGASNNAASRIPFVANPSGQPTTVTGASGSSFQNEIDLIDPNYKYPTGTCSWDRSGRFRSGTTNPCLLYTSPSPRDRTRSRMPTSA